MAGYDVIDATGGVSDPAQAIVKAAVDGSLTAYRRDALINESALQSMRAVYVGDLKNRISPLFVRAVHEQLQAGAADSILDSLRPQFDAAAEAINQARDLIPFEQSAESFMHSATGEALQAWQSLDGHLATITSIAAIASQFGCRTAKFPLIEEYAQGDGFRLDDRAIWCCDGDNIAIDSAPFMRPDRGHRASPWFKTCRCITCTTTSPARTPRSPKLLAAT